MNMDHFGMDTITLAGPLEAKLRVIVAAGFTQVMLNAGDVVGHPGRRGCRGARGARERPPGHRLSGPPRLRGPLGPPACLQARRGQGHARHVPRARGERAARLLVDVRARDGGPGCTRAGSPEAGASRGSVRHPHRLRGALLGPARQPPHPRVGDRAGRRPLEPRPLRRLLPHPRPRHRPRARSTTSIRARSSSCSSPISCGRRPARPRSAWRPRDTTACSPGEGVHSPDVVALVRKLDDTGYRGDYSFEVFNDDYKQLPLPMVAARARRSVKWLTGLVSAQLARAPDHPYRGR